MNIIQTLRKNQFLRDTYHGISTIFYSGLTLISPKLNTKARYRSAFKKKMDLKNPKTLNEKISWLKIYNYNQNPLIAQCADKYRVREYIKECGLEDILIPFYGVYKTADEIPWDSLPNQFVLKWNFGAGYNIVCTDKKETDRDAVLSKMKKWGKDKYWLTHSEMQYKHSPKRIVCEKLLNADETKNIKTNEWVAPKDYKIYCFNGEPKFIMVCVGREKNNHPKFYFFDERWQLARINRDSKNAPMDFSLDKPRCFEKLINSAKALSRSFPFVRVDLYAVEDKVYFGELTFTPSGGLDSNRLEETDIMMGNMLDITKVEKI